MRAIPMGIALVALACGSGSGGSGGGSGASGGSAGVGGAGAAAGAGASGGSGGSAGASGTGGGGSAGSAGAAGAAGAPACEPLPGTEVHDDAGCDQVRVAVIERSGEAPRLQVRARISLFGSPGACTLLDQVVLGDEQNALQTIELPGGVDASGEYTDTLFEVDAASAVSAFCADETQRIEPFGFIAKGRVDGGTFTAKCGPAGSGSGWPPRVVLTCHTGIWEQPYGGNSMVQSLGSVWDTTLYAVFPHPAGAWQLLSATGEVRILPATPPFSPIPPIAPFDTSGWSAWVGEMSVSGKTMSQLQLSSFEEELGTEVCPPIDPNEPFPDPNPVYIAKVSGQSSEGAFSSEIFVDICTRPPP